MPLDTLSYAEQARGFEGMISDIRDSTIESYIQGEASAEIGFGTAVAQGAASTQSGTPDKAILMVNGSSVVVGVLVHAHNYDRESQLGTVGVKPTNLLNLMRRGQVYMKHEGAVTKGQPCFVRHTAGAGGSQKGVVRADADTATAVSTAALTFAETKASLGDGIVLVNVNLGP
jgi:hypothetical protein